MHLCRVPPRPSPASAVLGLKQYPAVLSLLRPNMQREVALNIAQVRGPRGAA